MIAGPRGDQSATRAAEVLRERTGLQPALALILGSGLGEIVVLDADPEPVVVPFDALPGFASSAVPGHAKEVRLGTISRVPALIFSGRIHFYEGHPMDAVTMPARVAAELGVHTLVATAATGAVDPSLRAGDLVAISDHLNLMGESPLRGWTMPDGSPPFIDLAGAYDPGLRAALIEEAAGLGLFVATGVYAALPGPTYETHAEVASLRTQGASVVGMSMVPEVLAARANGIRVLGLATVANAVGAPIHHDEVVRVAADAAGSAGRLLTDLLPVLARAPV